MDLHRCRLELRSVLQLLLLLTSSGQTRALTIGSGSFNVSFDNSGTTGNISTNTVDSVFGLLEGNPLCPCIMNPGDLSAIDPQDLTDVQRQKLGAGLLVELQGNDSSYGIGCARHDLATPQCSNTNSSCDDVDTFPTPVNCDTSWCNRSWCYVDPVQCQLLSRRSLIFPHSDRFYSYATCGYADVFTANNRVASLAGKTIKVGFNSNTGGWLGSFSTDGINFKGPLNKWSGPYLDFIKEGALQGGFKLQLTEPPAQLIPAANEFFNSKSEYDYCIYVASLGFVDMCIAQYTITNQRASVTDWLLLGSTGIYLIVSQDTGTKKQGWHDFVESATTIFLPFTPASWLFIVFFVIPVLGCLMIIHETGKAGSTYPNEEIVIVKDKFTGASKIVKRKVPLQSKVLKSVYINLLGILQQSYEQTVTTLGAKLNLLGISFFILTICAAYTANLAALLTGQVQFSSIQSLQDAVDAGYRLCSSRKIMEAVLSLYPEIDPSLFVVDPVELGGDGRPGFNCPNCGSRTRVFEYLDPAKARAGDKRYCHAAMSPIEDLDVRYAKGLNCNLQTVGQPLQYTQTGIPIFEGISQEIISFFLLLKNEGYYDRIVQSSKPTSQCPANSGQGDSLSLSQLSGIWVVSFTFAVAGLIATAMQSCHSKYLSKVVVQRITKIDQRGCKIDALENEEDKVESFASRSGLGLKSRGRLHFLRSFRLSKRFDGSSSFVGNDDSPGGHKSRVWQRQDRYSNESQGYKPQQVESSTHRDLGISVLDDENSPKQKMMVGKALLSSHDSLNSGKDVSFRATRNLNNSNLSKVCSTIQEDQELEVSSSHHSRPCSSIHASHVESHSFDLANDLDLEHVPHSDSGPIEGHEP